MKEFVNLYGDWPSFYDYPYTTTYTSVSSAFTSIYHRRCNAIKKQLKKFNIKAEVSRSYISGINFYRIETTNWIYSGEFAKALGLKGGDVGVITSGKEGCLFLICEKHLHDLYLNPAGELVFNSFDFYKANTCEIGKQLEKALGSVFSVENITFNNKRYISIFILDKSDFDHSDIADALDVSVKNVEIIASNHCWIVCHSR